MSIVVPTAQFRTNYIFVASSTYDQNFVNIVAPLAADITLDGTLVPHAEFEAIGSSGYAVARHALDHTDFIESHRPRASGSWCTATARTPATCIPAGSTSSTSPTPRRDNRAPRKDDHEPSPESPSAPHVGSLWALVACGSNDHGAQPGEAGGSAENDASANDASASDGSASGGAAGAGGSGVGAGGSLIGMTGVGGDSTAMQTHQLRRAKSKLRIDPR